MNAFDPTSPDDAAEQLRTAQNIDRRLTGPVPALLVTYGLLCSATSSGVLLLHLAQGSTPEIIAVTAVLLAWAAAGIVVPFLFRQPLRRGLGARWGYYIAGWAVLWGIGVAVSSTHLAVVIGTSALFFALFMIAAVIEARVAKKARGAQHGTATK